MTETPGPAEEPATGPVATVPPPPPPAYVEATPVADRPNRLYQAAAWVAIVAGSLFIVGAVFFTGFALGHHSGYGGWQHRGDGSAKQFHQRGGPPMMPMPMMPRSGPVGPMGPGAPGGGPSSAPSPGPGGPGGASPGASPGASAIPTPRP